jgi:prolyl 4-hydroxylase
MKRNCAPACQSCDFLSTETRCPVDPNAPRAWIEGDLDRMFEKLTQEPYLSTYSVEILSSPATNGPWVITMEDIVNAAEAERLIELGSETGYTRSKGMAKNRPDGTPEHIVSEARTSSHTWCRHECSQDSIARSVIERLSNVTGIDKINSEFLQLLQYQPGQYYETHHGTLCCTFKNLTTLGYH